MRSSHLSLPDEVLLLTRELTGGAAHRWAAESSCGAGAAVLLELILAERLTVRDDWIRVHSPERHPDPLADACLGRLLLADRRRTLAQWLERLGPWALDATAGRLAVAPGHEGQLDRLRALFEGSDLAPEWRVAASAALLHSMRMAHLVRPGLSRRVLSSAVRHALDRCTDAPPALCVQTAGVAAAVEAVLLTRANVYALP